MRRWLPWAAGAVWLACCLVSRGGLLHGGHYGDVSYYGSYARQMADGRWPYRDFFDEYPPLAQPLFLLIHALPGSFTSAFRWTMALCGLALVVLLARRTPYALVAAIAPLLVGPIMLNTYDLFPALLLLLALVVWPRERIAMVLLALAVAAKVYPLVALPILLLESRRVRAALGWFAGTLLLVHLPFLLIGPGGLRFSYWVQLKRGLEVESSGAAVLLVLDRLGLYHATLRDQPPGSKNVVGATAQVVGTVSTLLVIAAVLFAIHRRYPHLLGTAAAVCGFVAFDKVFSPQYVTWLVGLVPVAGTVASALLLAILALTHVVFDRFHAPGSGGEHYRAALTWWVVARDALVVVLYVWLVRSRRASQT